MSDLHEDPAASRRRLLREIRQLRGKAGLTQRDVAEQLDWSPSKVVRIEQGDVTISTTDLRALVQLYGVSDAAEINELAEIAKISKRQSSWTDYKDIFGRDAIRFFGYESSASIIRQFEPLLIPGLLQTEEYTRALLRDSFGLSKDAIDRHVEARSARQEMLDRPTPPEMFFIVDEAATRRHVGSQNIMRRQLEHLVELSRYPTVTIQVLPFSVGGHPGMSGPFTLLEFPSDSEDIVLFLESRSDFVTRDDPEQIGRLLDTFWGMEKTATKPKELEAFFLERNYFSTDQISA